MAPALRSPAPVPAAVVPLHPEAFGPRERGLLVTDGLRAVGFRFPSGVAGLRLEHRLGEVTVLPFQGQQVWSARLRGRELAMRTPFDEPRPTRDYLATYGALLLHCGVAAMGAPGPDDDHPLHGELPNAPFRDAYLALGADEGGPFLTVGGRYRDTVAFRHDVLAEPRLTVRPGSGLLEVELTVRNRGHRPFALMYLAHLNFRPVDGGRLVYSAPPTPEHVRVRRSLPAHVEAPEGYEALLARLAREPALHHRLEPGTEWDPEVVFEIDYLADADGWAHSLQLHPDGAADYVRHRPAELPVGVRWLCRTPDLDALGLVLPATAGPEGYRAERAKGRLVPVPPGGSWRCRYALGALEPGQAARVEAHIGALLGGRPPAAGGEARPGADA